MGDEKRKVSATKETRALVATVNDIEGLRFSVMRWKGRALKANAALADARRVALIEAAEIADALRDATHWDDPSAGIAAQIRALAAKGTP